MVINGEESKYQVDVCYEKIKEKMKKHDKFKEEMTPKFIELLLKMPKVDMGEISKNWKSRPKTVQI